MVRVRDELPPATATEALSGLMVDQLRGLAVVATGEAPQGRKAELVERVTASLDGVGVRRIYELLDEVDRAAVAEAAYELRQSLRVLPNFEVTALDELTHADRLVLDRYAQSEGERVWRLGRDRLLVAVEAGESIERVREFLQARSATGMPDTVAQLLDDVAERSGALVDRGHALLIECSDRTVAALLSNDRRTSGLCLLAGDKALAVPAASEPAFRRAARELGYVLGPGNGHHHASASAHY